MKIKTTYHTNIGFVALIFSLMVLGILLTINGFIKHDFKQFTFCLAGTIFFIVGFNKLLQNNILFDSAFIAETDSKGQVQSKVYFDEVQEIKSDVLFYREGDCFPVISGKERVTVTRNFYNYRQLLTQIIQRVRPGTVVDEKILTLLRLDKKEIGKLYKTEDKGEET